MGHLRFYQSVIAASCFVLFAGDLAHAETKARGGAARPAEPTSLAPGARPGQANKSKTAAPPAKPEIKTIKVCLRPEGIAKDAQKWTFGQSFKPIDNDVERTAKLFGNRIYVFDEKADLDSPHSLPAPYNQQKCPNDKRKEETAPQSNGGGFLPPSGAAFPSAQILQSSGPLLGTGSLGSSGTGASSKALVDEFISKAQGYSGGTSDDEVQAAQFATQLHEALTQKKPLAEIAAGTLSPEAATILANAFGSSLTAAMAQQPVIGPLNALQKMVPTGKTKKWSVFPLMGKDVMDGWKIDSPDTIPAVILPLAEYERFSKAVAELIPGPLPPNILLDRYKHAYGDKPEWLASIKPYF